MRGEEDCQYIAAAVITECGDSGSGLALLFGLLCGAYLKHPDALFWKVLIDFLRTLRARNL
jgi:hypothetical protein